MGEETLSMIERVIAMGTPGLLLVLLVIAGSVIRHLYRQQLKCDDEQKAILRELGDVRSDTARMNAVIETEKEAREQHTRQMKYLHLAIVRHADGTPVTPDEIP
ncbi:MAG: hypothetical protein AAGG11_24095 [Pseudomonadota bacterium]